MDPNNRISWKQYFEHPFFVDSLIKNPTENVRFEDKYVCTRKLSDDFSEYKLTQAKVKETGEVVLIKEILRSAIDNNAASKRIFQKEIELMKQLKGENFIKLIDFCQNDTHYYIVTEYFEGKVLENFLSTRKTLSESLVQKILVNLAPGFKELHDNNTILEFLSTKNFCFKFFKSEDDFQIKFFDYGLSIIFTDLANQRNYLLNEATFGNIALQKTNVLSMGIVIYKLLFGQTIYEFTNDEDPSQTINKKKSIKLPKTISK